MRGKSGLGRLLAPVPAGLVIALGIGLVLLALARDSGGAGGEFLRDHFDGRAYRLYVPSAAAGAPAANPTLPLVMALHGCWQTPEDFARGTRLNEAAEQRGLIVLYPAQEPRANPSRCWNWFEATVTGGEVAELTALVRAVARERQVSAERIVVLGLSAGGFMAVNLACAAPELVSGVGVAAGGPYRCGVGVGPALQCMRGQHADGEAAAAACRKAMGGRGRRVRASLWHGAEDAVVNAANLDALAIMFARITDAVGAVRERRNGAVHGLYRDAGGRPTVETWLIPGMGHAWSGGDPRGTHTYPAGPAATERMLDFLLG